MLGAWRLSLPIVLLLAPRAAPAQSTTAPAPQRPSGADTAAIRRFATDLAADDMRGRGPWTSANLYAARRLAQQLMSLGARPLIGSSLLVPVLFPQHAGDTAYNVIAWIPPRRGSTDSSLIGITAHLDHLGVGEPDVHGDSIYNGFLDDAIGVAMVMDVARRFRRDPGERGLAIFFFNLEEEGLLGSRAFVADTQSRGVLARLRLMVGVDAGAPAGEALEWELMGATPPHPAALLADSLARAHGWTTRATAARGISDVFPFSRAGIPILFPIPGSRWRGYTPAQRDSAMTRFDHYHQPADQPNPAFPLVGTAYFTEWLWEIVDRTTR